MWVFMFSAPLCSGENVCGVWVYGVLGIPVSQSPAEIQLAEVFYDIFGTCDVMWFKRQVWNGNGIK